MKEDSCVGQVGDREMSLLLFLLSLPWAPTVSGGFPHHTLQHSRCLFGQCLSYQPRDKDTHREVQGGEQRAFAKIVYVSNQLGCTHSGLTSDSGLCMGTLLPPPRNPPRPPKGQRFQCPLAGSPRSTCCLRAWSPSTRNASAAGWDRCVNGSQGSGGGGRKACDDPARGQTIGGGAEGGWCRMGLAGLQVPGG